MPPQNPQFTVGQETTLNGKPVRITAIHPDGTADVEPVKTLGGFASNVMQSGGRFVKDVASAVTSPVETAKNILKLAGGTAALAIPGEQGWEKYPRAVGDMYAQRYGGAQNIADTFYEDPVGMAADLSTVLGMGGGALKAASLGNAASRTGQLAKVALRAADATNPMGIVGKGAEMLGHGFGTGIVEATVRPPAGIKAQQAKRFEASQAIAQHHIMSPSQAAERGRVFQGKVTDAAAASPYTTNTASLVQMPKTRGEVARNTLQADDTAALDAFRDKVLAENPAVIPQSRVLEIKRDANRQANPEFRAAATNMPTGERPIVGSAWEELAKTASGRLHDNVPGTKQLDNEVRRMILAEGAVKAARNRPHLMSKLMAAGALTGSALGYNQGVIPAMAFLALDSPLVGQGIGSAAWALGSAANSKAATRAALLARMGFKADPENPAK